MWRITTETKKGGKKNSAACVFTLEVLAHGHSVTYAYYLPKKHSYTHNDKNENQTFPFNSIHSR